MRRRLLARLRRSQKEKLRIDGFLVAESLLATRSQVPGAVLSDYRELVRFIRRAVIASDRQEYGTSRDNFLSNSSLRERATP
jgi:hypothetical protein